MFIDTHAHVNMMITEGQDTQLNQQNIEKIRDIVNQAYKANVGALINVGTTIPEILNSIKMAQACDNLFVAAGIHPCECKSDSGWNLQIQHLKALLGERKGYKIVAVGEIGFDFFHQPFDIKAQNIAFRSQIELAHNCRLPIIIHVRNAADQLLQVLDEYVKDGLKGVIHCFSQNQDFADQVLKWGFYIGIDGHITYPKNIELCRIIKGVPMNKLLLETDAPFLPPQQFRGKQNSPAYIPLIAEFIANLKGVELKDLETETTRNAINLFNLEIV